MSWHIPIGYEWVDGTVQVSGRFKDLVIQIFMDFDSGKSTNQIARELNEKGVVNTHGRVAWTHGAIGRILENSCYLGIDGYQEIIEKELFYRVQKRREQIRAEGNRGEHRPDKNNRQIFEGVLVCAECGGFYTYRQPNYKKGMNAIPKWKCKRDTHPKKNPCNNSFVSDAQIKNVCVYAINRFMQNSGLIKRYAGKTQKTSKEFRSLDRVIEQSENLSSEELMELLFRRAAERYKTLEIRDEEIQTEKMRVVLEEQEELEEFNERLYRRLIKKIIVYPNNTIKVVFHNKDSLKVSY